MAKKWTFHFCYSSTMVIILVLSALISLGITLALGIGGIVVATQDNICNDGETANHEGCIQEESDEVNSTVTDNKGLMVGALMNPRRSYSYFYWLIGATGCGLLFFSIGGTCCTWTAAQVLYEVMKAKKSAKDQELLTVQTYKEAKHFEREEDTSEVCESTDYVPYNTKVWIETEGIDTPKNDPQKWEEYKEGPGKKVIRVEDGLYELVSEYNDGLRLKKLRAGALVSMWFGFLCGISSVLCLMWSFALGFNRSRKFEQTVTPFVVANILSGIVAPVLFFISGFILVNIADYFTNHKIQARLILTRFFPLLKFEAGQDSEGEKCIQWVIADSLVLKISKEEYTPCILPIKIYRRYFQFCAKCLPNCSTILLSIVVVLSLMICFIYLIDITLVDQVTVSSCSDPNINAQYSCFQVGTLIPVNCISSNVTEILHCYRFFNFSVEIDWIAVCSSAFAFYLLTNRLIAGAILVLKVMHTLTNRLGTLCIGSGLLLFFTTVVICFLWVSGYSPDAVRLLAFVDLLHLAQLLMVSLFIIIVGFLVRKGEWMEKRPAKHQLVKFEKNADNHPVCF